ncbi:hypothetical protein WA158_006120 [Blastocystis sp. Blastoise]
MVVYACPYGEYEATLQRKYAKNAGEIIQLYSGDSANLRNTLAFNDESDASQDTVVDYKVCIDGHTDYNLELMSKNSPTWADGSLITLTYNEIILVKTSLNKDGNGKKVIKFNLSSLVDSRMNWKYSTSVDSASWKESKIEEWGEDYKNKEIKNAEITTYFRKDIYVDNSFTGLQLSIQSQSGYIVYVNGIQVDTYLLPGSSKINENTPSQSLEDIPTYKHTIVPKESFASSVSLTILKIAIELHTTADRPELLSSFDILTYINDSKDSMNTLSMLASRRLQDIPEYTMNAFEENQFIDFSAILSLSLSNCQISTPLFAGLTLSSNCILSGIPTVIRATQYNLHYNYGEDGSSSGVYIFNFGIDCDPLSCAHLRVSRITTNYASTEKVIIKSGDGNKIGTIVQDSYEDQDYLYYGPVGTWSFELIKETSGVWSEGSTVTAKVIDDVSYTAIIVTKMRTMHGSRETYYVNTAYSMLMNSEWKYNTYNSIPSKWYESSVDDSNWSTVIGSTAITPSGANQYFVFRKTINTPSIANQKYFILKFKTLTNIKIYINNHELAVYGFKDGYANSASTSTSIEQTATGPLSLFDNQETITISVLLFDKKHTIDISFDASLLIFVDNNIPVYSDYEVTAKNVDFTSNLNALLDLSYFSNTIVTGLSAQINPIISIKFNDGHKYFDRYCMTIPESFENTPISWIIESIDENGNRHEHSVVLGGFSANDPTRKCFFLTNVNSGINNLEITLKENTLNNMINQNYHIFEIEFFVDNLNPESLPLLSTTYNPYSAYDDTTISISFMNSDYYHDFTITPSLPDGLTFDTNTGSISGIIHGNDGETVYIIHATSICDSPADYELTIQIQSCVFPKNLMNVHLNFDNSGDYFYIFDYIYTSSSIYSIINYHNEKSEDVNACVDIGTYYISMNCYNYVTPTYSYIYVNNKLHSEFKNERQYLQIDIRTIADSTLMPVVYSYDNVNPPKQWTTNTFNDNMWSKAPSLPSLPVIPNDSITQYYRMHFDLKKFPSKIDRLDFNMITYEGMIIYLNGIEIRRINMHDGDVEFNTLATCEYSEYKSVRSIISLYLDPQLLINDNNIISVEIHKCINSLPSTNRFSVSLSYLTKSEELKFDSEWSVNGDVDPDHPLSKLNDNIYNSYVLVNHECVNTIFVFTYKDDVVNRNNLLYIDTQNSLSPAYRPTSIIYEGSNNHGESWSRIMEQTGMQTSGDYYSIRIDDQRSFNSYRVIVTECGSDDSITENNKMTMTELIPQYDIYYMYCQVDTFPPTATGLYSQKTCNKGYISDYQCQCGEEEYYNCEGSNTCEKKKPSELYFKNKSIIMTKGYEYEQTYTIDALDADVTVTPDLPDGITLDTTSQKIYGTPTTISPLTTYTLSFINSDNNEQTYDISITVLNTYCMEENEWPKTPTSESVTIPCSTGYIGTMSRYCNSDRTWSEPNIDNCIQCTGYTYYDGTQCTECINGVVATLNGHNYACNSCSEDTYYYDHQCLSNDVMCYETTIDNFIYPDTYVGYNGVSNCTNENQYGYYHTSCNYISNNAEWSDEINKDLCYSRPFLTSGKVMQILDYSTTIASTTENVFDLLYPICRSFIKVYPYQLTDLFLTTNYTNNSYEPSNSILHVYYGSSVIYYTSSKQFVPNHMLFGNNLVISTESKSTLVNTKTEIDTTGYCNHPDDDSLVIPANTYHISQTDDGENFHAESYYCKQNQFDYSLIPIKTVDIPVNKILGVSITFIEPEISWIGPDVFITIFRSLLKSIDLPINTLDRLGVSTDNPPDKTISIFYYISFPSEIQIIPSSGLWLNQVMFKELLTDAITFKYTEFKIDFIPV